MRAPIILFVYARPEHTRLTVESLLANPESCEHDLIVYSDAAKDAEKVEAVERVRNYIESVEGFNSITLRNRPNNFGLAKSIISGVSEVLTAYDRVIVLEDDMVTSRYFLSYMNEALDRFEADGRVISIHGYVYPVRSTLPEAFFLKGADCWGWATWRRGWAHFNPDGQALLDELESRGLSNAFDFNGSYEYSKMLKDQIKGRNDSWAIRWYASAFLADKLTLYPGRSLVHNIGNDSSGTHCGTNDAYDVHLADTPVVLEGLIVEPSSIARKSIEKFFRQKPSLLRRIFVSSLFQRMWSKLKVVFKDWLPPVLFRSLGRFRQRSSIRFEGPYSTWQEAAEHSRGYDNQEILTKVLSATIKVKRGEAAYERDSVLFDKVQYAWPIATALMLAAAKRGGQLHVLDFGGALGSSYYQNRSFLAELTDVQWSVVEQVHYVKAGKSYIEDGCLRFYESIHGAIERGKPDLVLISSVLQYLPEPLSMLEEILSASASFVVIDRTPFLNSAGKSLINVQHTPSTIYSASYPCWFFNEADFIAQIQSAGYKKLIEFDSLDRLSTDASWKGYVFHKATLE